MHIKWLTVDLDASFDAHFDLVQSNEQTVGAFCKSHGLMFRSPPRGLYLGLQDRGAQTAL